MLPEASYKASLAHAAVLASAKATSGLLSFQRKGITLVLQKEPVLLEGAVQFYIRAYKAGKELRIDGDRVIGNPPIYVSDGTTRKESHPDTGKVREVPNLKQDPYEAIISALFDSIESTPNPSGWVAP